MNIAGTHCRLGPWRYGTKCSPAAKPKQLGAVLWDSIEGGQPLNTRAGGASTSLRVGRWPPSSLAHYECGECGECEHAVVR